MRTHCAAVVSSLLPIYLTRLRLIIVNFVHHCFSAEMCIVYKFRYVRCLRIKSPLPVPLTTNYGFWSFIQMSKGGSAPIHSMGHLQRCTSYISEHKKAKTMNMKYRRKMKTQSFCARSPHSEHNISSELRWHNDNRLFYAFDGPSHVCVLV